MPGYADQALSTLTSRLQLELTDLQERAKARESDVVSTLNERLTNNTLTEAQGGYDLNDARLDNFPLAQALAAKKDFAQRAKAQDDATARAEAIRVTQGLSQEAQQEQADKRAQLGNLLRFKQRPLAELEQEAPQLENLRSDIVVDPATGGYKQQKKVLGINDERTIRDQEIADYYGVDVGLARGKRLDQEGAIAKASLNNNKELWRQVRIEHSLERFARQRTNDAQEDAKEKEQALHKNVTDAVTRDNRARGMSEVTRNRILNDPESDPYSQEVAKLSQEIANNVLENRDFKDQLSYRDAIMKEKKKEHGFLTGGDYSEFDFAKALTQSTVQAEKEWPIRQQMKKEREALKQRGVGAGADVDKMFNSLGSLSDDDLAAQIAEAQAAEKDTPRTVEWATQGGQTDTRPYSGLGDMLLDNPISSALGNIGTRLNAVRARNLQRQRQGQ